MAMVMRWAWYAAMLAGIVIALMPVEHLHIPVFQWWDKAQHALGFAVLTTWALLLWPRHTTAVLAGMLAYGAFIEAAQWAAGWRMAEWPDLAADAIGILIAWALVRATRQSCKLGS